MLSDNVKAWQMQPDGTYCRVNTERAAVNSQQFFLQRSASKRKISKFKPV
jgi:polyphosphate kinase